MLYNRSKVANRTNHNEEKRPRTKKVPFALEIGLSAGILWGAVRWLFYYFGFTNVVPGFMVEPFFKHDFLAGTGGFVVGYAGFIAMSLIAALIYTLFAAKFTGPWPGVLYGVIWFVGLYMLIGPWLGMLYPLGRIDWDSLWTDLSIFVVWGVFIGYSITFEFTDEKLRSGKEGILSTK